MDGLRARPKKLGDSHPETRRVVRGNSDSTIRGVCGFQIEYAFSRCIALALWVDNCIGIYRALDERCFEHG